MTRWPPSVRPEIPRPAAADVEAAALLSTATLHEAAGKQGALPAAIKPVSPGMRLCGPAVTVACPPGHNLHIHHALYLAQPGDVLVVVVGGAFEYGYWGEIMTVAAQARDLGGLVIDGCVRDGARLADLGFPVFARGLCIRGTGKSPADGTINHPIDIGDIQIKPGDLVVGDVDGVVVLERDVIGAVVAAARRRDADEEDHMAALRNGERTVDLFGWSANALT
jgi:4-hydroxy-4-methyl-2-oxoglutarate aldolase